MNITQQNNQNNNNEQEYESITTLVPSRNAYLLGFLTLLLSSTAGGFIGYASSKIFVSNPSIFIQLIFAVITTIAIAWSMSIVVSIGLKASVEFKSRKKLFPNKKRPSRSI